MITAQTVTCCRAVLPGLTVVDVGPAPHFLPEDRPAEIAGALDRWLPA